MVKLPRALEALLTRRDAGFALERCVQNDVPSDRRKDPNDLETEVSSGNYLS
jgi:hypothetical protein